MDVTIQIPDDIAPSLTVGGDLPRRALEALALEEYKNARISKAQLRRMLGFETRYELDGFLKAHDVVHDLPTIEDVRQEVATLRRLGF